MEDATDQLKEIAEQWAMATIRSKISLIVDLFEDMQERHNEKPGTEYDNSVVHIGLNVWVALGEALLDDGVTFDNLMTEFTGETGQFYCNCACEGVAIDKPAEHQDNVQPKEITKPRRWRPIKSRYWNTRSRMQA